MFLLSTFSRRRRRRRRSSSVLPLSLFVISAWLLLVAVATAASTASSASTSLYQTLGVSPEASSKEITKAYRKQCLKHHPDKGGNEDTFKQVSEAYQVLSDPEKKKLYDAYGTTDTAAAAGSPFGTSAPSNFAHRRRGSSQQPSGFYEFFQSSQMPQFGAQFGSGAAQPQQNLEEIFRRMMMGQGLDAGGFTRQQQRPQAQAPYTRVVTCTLPQLYQGVTKKLQVRFPNSKSRIYSIKLQPHWKTGTKIKFPATRDFPPMVFVLQEQHDDVYRRRGDYGDVVYVFPIRFQDLRKEASKSSNNANVKLKIPDLDGRTHTKTIRFDTLEQLVRQGRPVILSGQGLAKKHSSQRGDLLVIFR
jgi:DnaJ family protein B protein 4